MSLVNVMEVRAASHWDAHAVCANFKNVQSNAGEIHGRDMLPARGKKQGISSGPASDIQRLAGRQKWQQFADDTRGLRGRRLGCEPVLGIPLRLVRRHKKGS